MCRHRVEEEEVGEALPRKQTHCTIVRESHPRDIRSCTDPPQRHPRSTPNRDRFGSKESDPSLLHREAAARVGSLDIHTQVRVRSMRLPKSRPPDNLHTATRALRHRNTRHHDLRNSAPPEVVPQHRHQAAKARCHDPMRRARSSHSFDTPALRSCPMDSSHRWRSKPLRNHSNQGCRVESTAWSLHIDWAHDANQSSPRE